MRETFAGRVYTVPSEDCTVSAAAAPPTSTSSVNAPAISFVVLMDFHPFLP